MVVELRLNFIQFHAITANLGLIINTINELNVAIREITNQVASFVEFCIFFTGKCIRQKPLRTQIIAVKITTSDAIATDIKLSRNANWEWLHALIQHIQSCILNGPTNWRQRLPVFLIANEHVFTDHVRFGWTVLIVKTTLCQLAQEILNMRGNAQLFASGNNFSQSRRYQTTVLRDLRQLIQRYKRQIDTVNISLYDKF